jgi:hypothetical protein
MGSWDRACSERDRGVEVEGGSDIFNDSSNNMHHGNSISPDNQGNGRFIWDQH